MAPEIGRVAEVDGRADIYSLGLTYYYLLTGRQPYEGCSLDDILFRRVRLANPERYAPDLPGPHRRVLGTMLAWERDDRYADAAALGRDLRALLEGEPVEANSRGPWAAPIPPTLDPEGATGGGVKPPPVVPPLSASSAQLVNELAQASEDPRNLVGARYLLLTELDPSGGMRLYRAWDTQDECLISLRIFDGISAVSPSARRDMTRAAKLRHPYLLPLRHSRLHGGNLYAAMYPVRGHSLLGLSGPGARLRSEDAARVVRDVARALAHAHGKGQVHGGLQPDSVLVGPEGQGLLLDMGLGAVVRQATRGLPSRLCLAPECDGRSPPTPRSDVYSLGVVLSQALAGEPPECDRPTPPGVLVTGVLPELDAICMRCLASDPDDRYASARELERDLGAFLAGAVPRSHPPRRSAAALPAHKRKTELALLASVTLLVLTGMLLLSARTRATIMEEQAQRYESMLILLEQKQRQTK
jgi:serine/threonine protein kinase